MSTRRKQPDMSWGKFILFMIVFYGFLMLLYYTFEFISQPALEYDRKQNERSLQINE